jgi:tetratricopeptide (TPR) repeat protein
LTDRDELLERFWSLGDEGAWEDAAELLREHLEEFDEDPAMHCWLGVAEREVGMDGVAYERFRRALALGPEDPYVLSTAGNGVAAFDDPDAEQALRTAALIAPGIAVTRLLYGAYLAREGMVDLALAELTAAREIDPDDPQIAYELGIAHAFAYDWENAADALSDAVRLDPEEGWTRVVFGLVLIEGGRLEEGAGELVSGARILEDDVDAQLVAALSAAATGLEDTAWEMLERARLNALDGDLALVTGVEDRLDAGHEAAQEMLTEEMGPDLLRSRMSERP